MYEFFGKKLNKKGFTLAELLVVVAIIAVLVAISIPIFSSNLAKAQEATDEANIRAAKAAATVEYLDGKDGPFYYDAVNGRAVTTTNGSGVPAYGQTSTTKNKIVKITINTGTDAITTEWVTPGASE